MAVRCPSIQKDIASACKASQEASILRSMRDHDDQTQTRAHILARNWNQVLELGRAWSQAEPNEPIARLLLVTGLLLKGDYREAYVQHERLFRLPDEADADMEAQQDPRAALRAFARQLAEGHPDNPRVRLSLGLTLGQVA